MIQPCWLHSTIQEGNVGAQPGPFPFLSYRVVFLPPTPRWPLPFSHLSVHLTLGEKQMRPPPTPRRRKPPSIALKGRLRSETLSQVGSSAPQFLPSEALSPVCSEADKLSHANHRHDPFDMEERGKQEGLSLVIVLDQARWIGGQGSYGGGWGGARPYSVTARGPSCLRVLGTGKYPPVEQVSL